MTRREFFQCMFPRPQGTPAFSEPSGSPVISSEEEDEHSSGPDYRSMLPPEFSNAILEQEVIRLGGNPEAMTQNDMAAMVVRALYSASPAAAQGQEGGGPVQGV